MYFLNGQTMTVELDAAHTTTASEYVISYFDLDTKTETTQVGTTNGTTPVTIISDPSSAQRILNNLTLYNKDTVAITATFKIVVSAVGYRLYKAKIPVGGTAIYVHGSHSKSGRIKLASGWCIRDRRGQILHGANSPDYASFFYRPTGRKNSGATQALFATGSPQITWVGQASRGNFTTCEYVFRVTTAATVVTWSEIALCTAKIVLANAGGMAPDCAVPFTARGYGDLTVPIASTGIKTGSFAVSGIEPGDDMFLAFSNLSSTQPQLRSGTLDNTYCHQWGSGNTGLRFSTQLNIPFPVEPADGTDLIEVCAHIF